MKRKSRKCDLCPAIISSNDLVVRSFPNYGWGGAVIAEPEWLCSSCKVRDERNYWHSIFGEPAEPGPYRDSDGEIKGGLE